MPYTNTTVTTSVSGSWNGTSISYSTIELIDGIPHSAQLEVERIFTIDRSGNPITDFLNNTATTAKDKRDVFVIPISRITFNETNKTITAIDLPSTGNTYDFDPEGVGVSNVPVPVLNVGNTLKIRRKTVSNQALVTWSAGTKLTSNQLNLETTQLLHLLQEVIDKIQTETTVTNTTIGSVPDSSITPAKLSGGGPSWTSGGALSSTSIQNTPIGSTTKSTGAFTTLTANNDVTMTAGTASSSTVTGTLVITGGAGVSGTVYAGGFNGPITGDVTGNVTGTVLTASQPNITSLGTLSSATISGNLTVDTDTLFVDSNNNRVGVGTNTPNTVLDVNGIMYSKIPCFYAKRTTLTNQTAAGTVIFNEEDLDNLNNYDTSTGEFTAPISGIYEFHFSILARIETSTANSVASFVFQKTVSSTTTAVSPLFYTTNNNAIMTNLNYVQVASHLIINLNANDKISVKLNSTTGGAGVLAASGGPVAHSCFSGKLIARS